MDNSLENRRPELICEWSDRNLPLTARDVTYGSNKVYWWKGKCGHEWQASVKARSSGENCPICSGARVIEGINDLATLKPELAREWSEKNEIKPTEVSIGSHKKVLWKCRYDHEWEASVKSRTVNGTGCPYCSHNMILPGFNDLEALFPQVAQEWSKRNLPLLPSQVTAYSNRKAWWECEHGHEWQALISTRSYGSKCPICSGIILLPGFNDLATTNPEVASEWSERNLPLKPDMLNAKSTKNLWWKCATCGYEWKAVVKARVNGQKCPVCADRAVLTGYNDLETTDPDVIAEWSFSKNTDVKPTQISRNSLRYVWWKCKRGHSWRDKIAHHVIGHSVCHYCESEFSDVVPELLLLLYAKRESLELLLDDETAIGFSLDAYLPEINLAFSFPYKGTRLEHDTQFVIDQLCKMRGIRHVRISSPHTSDKFCAEIKKAFRESHIYINSDNDEDLKAIRKAYFGSVEKF